MMLGCFITSNVGGCKLICICMFLLFQLKSYRMVLSKLIGRRLITTVKNRRYLWCSHMYISVLFVMYAYDVWCLADLSLTMLGDVNWSVYVCISSFSLKSYRMVLSNHNILGIANMLSNWCIGFCPSWWGIRKHII